MGNCLVSQLLGSLGRDPSLEVQLAASIRGSPEELVDLRRRLEMSLVSELKEIARRSKLPSSGGKGRAN